MLAPRAFQQSTQAVVERVVREGGRGALLLVELDAHYARRAAQRMPEALELWRRRHPEAVACGCIDERRFVFVIAPAGGVAHVRALADQLLRTLDSRVCPLLQRALPFGWSGAALFPDAGSDAESLLAGSQRDLDERRRGGARCRNVPRARRRHAVHALLQPLPVR